MQPERPGSKQSKYLAGLLEEDEAEVAIGTPAASPERTRPTTLLSRESALARVQSGEVRQITQLMLDPSRVRVWPGNARRYEALNEINCRELIDTLIAEGGQRIPAIVRRVSGDPDHEYEVIAGTRRHWSISWLRRNSYPEMRFLAQVQEMDDEAAFRVADVENRARSDVSDVERARNYAAALKDYYGGQQVRMAERLRVSKGWLSKMLKVATLPDPVLDAFASLNDVQLKPGYALAQALDDRAAAKRIRAAAEVMAGLQAAARERGEAGLVASEVMRRLLAAAANRGEAVQGGKPSYLSKAGRPALTVQSANRSGITILIHADSGADHDELVEVLLQVLKEREDPAKATGRRA